MSKSGLVDMDLIGVDVESGLPTKDACPDIDTDRPAVGEDGTSETVHDRGSVLVSNGTENNGAVVTQRVSGDRESVRVADNGANNMNGEVVDNKPELKARVTGRPWEYPDHIRGLLNEGWKPTRWEKGTDVVEYPVEGGIRAMLSSNGQVHEWSPDGVLTLHGVKSVILVGRSDTDKDG